ncbi:MAG: N-acetylmuramoyl-L-alanine amidase [Clostridia bacterium]|nr:N-acetylmuramoyl-L-alanine amidase [Clostridia bacterium]
MKKTVLALSMAVVMGFVAAVALCIQALAAPQAVFSMADTAMRIVLDAGHGGIDGGVTGAASGVRESDLNLQITMALKDELEDIGFEVVLTRKTEEGLYGTTAKGFKKRDMQKRKEIIEEAKPSLVISVHQNFYPLKSTRGAQVFYSKESEEGKALALALQEKLNGLYSEESVKPRSAALGEYYMLECTAYPSVIVECGFLSNAKDEALLQSAVWQKKLCESVASGVVAYLSAYSS